MTTYTIYADLDDQYCYCSSATYANARNGTGSLASGGSSGANNFAGQQYAAPNYYVYQAQMSFDTSVVPAGTPSSNPTLTVNLNSVSVSDTYRIAEYAWSAGSAAFVAGTSLSGLTQFGTQVWSSSGSKTVTGPSDVTRSATYKLIVHNMDQQNNVAPTTTEFAQINSANGSNDPYLTIIVPTTADLGVTLDELTVSATGSLEIGATAGITLGDVTISAEAGNIVRGSLTVTLADLELAATAQGLVPVTTPPGRILTFETSQLSGRTLSLI